MQYWRFLAIVASLLVSSGPPSPAQQRPAEWGAADIAGVVVVHADVPQPAPEWAVLERRLIETMNRAGLAFAETYARPDGTLVWKERYEGGMNSSDDAYEAFRGFSLHHILGGSKKLDTVHRHIWEGITRQFTRYGQIYREFDSNWDWMHHGEGYVSFYPFGLADPNDQKFRDRSIKFAAMYIGEDPEAPNYDPELKIIRAPMNGSRGPKLEWVKRDWIPTNANLVYYHLPFDDIPGVTTSSGWINDHPSDDQFARIVQTMSDRMAKGDVPINLTATPLIANAFLYTGNPKYRRWIEEYVRAWEQRTQENGGITPDNVGLSGKIGEHNGGHWWGGYYGWKWVRGGTDIVLAEVTSAKVATLVTGNDRWLHLPRSQLAVMREQGKVLPTLKRGDEVLRNVPVVPIRYDDRNGWHHFVPEIAAPYVHIWWVSQDERDWKHIERLAPPQLSDDGKGRPRKIDDPDLAWAHFVRGKNPSYPEAAFSSDLSYIANQLQHILNEHGDPETWYDAKWLALDPMPTDNLVRLTVGGLPVHRRGEMLHSRLRYFDPGRLEAGLPQGVSALVTGLGNDFCEVELVNTNLFEPRAMIVQGGAYGEHEVTEVTYRAAREAQPAGVRAGSALLTEDRTVEVNGPFFEVRLDAGAGTTLRLRMRRYSLKPSYAFPWHRVEAKR